METNINELAKKISRLTTDELDKLSSILTNKFGIFSNIYPYPVGIISIDEQSTYDVKLRSAGSQKLRVLKSIKEWKLLGLKEAKDIIDRAPCIIFEDISVDEAEFYQKELEKIGAIIELI